MQLQQGKQVPAGTLNHDGLLVVEATKGFQDSTPARIARLTAQAQASSLHQLQLYAAACYNIAFNITIGMDWVQAPGAQRSCVLLTPLM